MTKTASKGLLIFILVLILVSKSFSQSSEDSIKTQKADVELTILGGSVSLYKKSINKHRFGLSMGINNYGYIISKNHYYQYESKPLDDSRGVFELVKIKLFYRYEITPKLLIQTGLKYNYTMFGGDSCDPCYDGLYGLESSLIYKIKNWGFKMDISTLISTKRGKFFVIFNPIIFCFNF